MLSAFYFTSPSFSPPFPLHSPILIITSTPSFSHYYFPKSQVKLQNKAEKEMTVILLSDYGNTHIPWVFMWPV